MNIVFYKSNSIVAEKGGISRITVNLADLFRRKGNNVWMIGAKDTYTDAVYDKQQLFLPEKGSVCNEKNLDFLTTFVRDNKINVIINQNTSQGPHVNLLSECASRTGVKVLYCFHNSILTPVYNYAYSRQFPAYEQGRPWVYWLLRSWPVRLAGICACLAKYYGNYKNIIEKNHAVILLCEGQVEELKKASFRKAIPNAHVIYNSMEAPKEGTGKEKQKHVLWVGNFDYHIKRPDNMLRIWKAVEAGAPEWTLYMLGDGPALNRCKEMAKEMNLKNVVFTGRVNPREYYQEAEILCTTSVHECFPMVLLEGMNNRLALVAFNSFTSAKLLVEEQDNGKLVKAFDLKKYSQTLLSLMKNDEVRHRFQVNARLAAARFNEESVYGMWNELFNE